jgi:hypothetical protein
MNDTDVKNAVHLINPRYIKTIGSTGIIGHTKTSTMLASIVIKIIIKEAIITTDRITKPKHRANRLSNAA